MTMANKGEVPPTTKNQPNLRHRDDKKNVVGPKLGQQAVKGAMKDKK